MFEESGLWSFTGVDCSRITWKGLMLLTGIIHVFSCGSLEVMHRPSRNIEKYLKRKFLLTQGVGTDYNRQRGLCCFVPNIMAL